MLVDCEFFTDKSVNSSATNFQTQEGFIFGRTKYEAAMLIEGNYWYNEAANQNYFSNFKKTKGHDRELGWMSLPTKLEGTVEEDLTGVGYQSSLIDTSYSYCFVNKNAMNKNSEGYRNAVMDFIKFLYTDNQLESFTKITGTAKAAIDYDFTNDDVFDSLSGFQKQILTLKKNNGVAYATAVNETFKNRQLEFQFGIEAPIWSATVNNISYKDYISAFKDPNNASITVEDVVAGSFITPDVWMNAYYKGK